MEEHAILRIPEELKESSNKELDEDGFVDCNFDFTDENNMIVEDKNKKYRASIIFLPCIIESQKSFDDNQFHKINDFSKMIAVWPENFTDVEINQYTMIYSSSGITPPLKFVKYRRWRERSKGFADVEEIEKKVKELRKDEIASSYNRYFY